jgi:hypothetical protein
MTEKTNSGSPLVSNKFLNTLLLVLLIPYIIVALLIGILWRMVLYLAVWIAWGSHKRYVLFVYSDSLIWKEYIENEILPHIQDRAVFLNWSERKTWRHISLAVLVFRHFGGHRNFNPMAVVFRPFKLVKEIRFYEAFREFKEGDPERVEKLKAELFETIGVKSVR